MRLAPAIDLSPEQRAELQKMVRLRTTPVRVAERCRIVLLAGDGLQDKQIAAACRWRRAWLLVGAADSRPKAWPAY